MKSGKQVIKFVFLATLCYFSYNAFLILRYANNYTEKKSDVAIVLGAATYDAKVSPVFRERLNHAVYLFESKKVDYVILTGGYGTGQNDADSEIAKKYILKLGVPEHAILIETSSKYTVENLQQAKHIMDSLSLSTALIVSDPLHMKRSIALAEKLEINCQPSPTKTSMYKSIFPKAKSLLYETFYYSLGQIVGKN
jgi:uncharacterized SAM-binding protein YcdF (DUF218 family)